MSDREQLSVFLREIKDRPEDDTPRLILADWLQDRGDPRGEFIHLQVTRARLRLEDPRADELRRRECELLRDHVFGWLGPFADVCSSWGFERGFLRLTVRAFHLFAAWERGALEAWDWVEGLKLTGVRMGDARTLARLGLVKDLPDLDLSGNTVGDLQPLLSSDASTLRSLQMQRTYLRLSQVDGLTACPYLANLRLLDLRDNRLDDPCATSLARSPYLGRLERLEVSGNLFSDEGRMELAAAFGRRAIL